MADEVHLAPDNADEVVTFVVGDKRISANKAQLEVHLHPKDGFQSDEIHIEDCSPKTFAYFLEMVKSGNVHIDSPKMALELVELAENFYWLKLFYACEKYLIENYGNECCILIFERAMLKYHYELAGKCFYYIVDNIEEVLMSQEFTEVDVDTVAQFYQHESFVENNIDAFTKALIKFSKTWSTRNLRPKEEARTLVHDLTLQLPFEKMTAEQFMGYDDIDYLLDHEESLIILNQLLHPNSTADTYYYAFSVQPILE